MSRDDLKKSHRKESLIKGSLLTDFSLKYKFVKKLGKGGFGVVNLYEDRKNSELTFAVKTIKKNYVKLPKIQYIRDEVKLLKTFDHPNIVKYHHTYEDDSSIHIFTEYIPGPDLETIIAKNGRFTRILEEDAVEIITYLAKAVLFLHNKNVIHRDIKLSNILFSNEQNYKTLKLIDFGLSVEINHACSSVVGSLLFIAPEVLTGNYSFKIDCWSIGVIIYIMLTGKCPFDSYSREEIITLIKNGQYPKEILDTYNVSKEAKDIIKKLLVVDPKERLSIEGILKHSWIMNNSRRSTRYSLSNDIIKSLIDFQNKNVLQKEVLFNLARLANDDMLEKVREAFIELDTNNTGTIEYKDVIQAFQTVGKMPDETDMKLIWDNLDFHKDGKVHYSEFLAASIQSMNDYFKDDKLYAVFKIFDLDDEGVITYDSIVRSFRNNNIEVNEQGLFEYFKRNRLLDSKVGYSLFKTLFEEKHLIKEFKKSPNSSRNITNH